MPTLGVDMEWLRPNRVFVLGKECSKSLGDGTCRVHSGPVSLVDANNSLHKEQMSKQTKQDIKYNVTTPNLKSTNNKISSSRATTYIPASSGLGRPDENDHMTVKV